MMIHQGHTSGFEGQATDIEIRAREILALQRRMEEIMAADTGQTVDQIHTDTQRDYFMTAEEARDYGLVDTVVSGMAGERPAAPGSARPAGAWPRVSTGARPRLLRQSSSLRMIRQALCPPRPIEFESPTPHGGRRGPSFGT